MKERIIEENERSNRRIKFAQKQFPVKELESSFNEHMNRKKFNKSFNLPQIEQQT